MEWVRRYLPLEIARWAGELGFALAAYWLTDSFAAAVVVGTIGASVGYYATAYVNADAAFYVMAIFSYERFTGLLVRPQREPAKNDELVPTLAAA